MRDINNKRVHAIYAELANELFSRIENGSMNASTKMLSEIAQATKQRLTIQFSPAF